MDYVLSRENDRQLEREVKKFATHFTNVKPILIFRRHGSWIASQYRRFVKNGLSISFEEFVDIDNNMGYWDKGELDFFVKIQIVEKHFDHKPLILFHEELKADARKFFDRLAEYCRATYHFEEIDTRPTHKSYNENQLKFMRGLGKYVLPYGRSYSSNKVVSSLQRWWRMLIKYPILFVGGILPGFVFGKKEFASKEYMARIDEMWAEDWRRVEEYAKANNKV